MHVGESESLSMQLRVYVKEQIKAERRGSRKSSFSAKRRDKVFIILSLHKSSFPWISKNKTNTVILCIMFLLSKAKWISSEWWWSPTRPWRSPCCTISQNQRLIQYLISFKSHCPCYFFSKKNAAQDSNPCCPTSSALSTVARKSSRSQASRNNAPLAGEDHHHHNHHHHQHPAPMYRWTLDTVQKVAKIFCWKADTH